MARYTTRRKKTSHKRRRRTKVSRKRQSRRRYSKNKYNRGFRPSPRESATLFKVGDTSLGQDGKYYVVSRASNGVKRWVKDHLRGK